MKTAFYNTHSYKAQQRQGWAGSIGFGNDTHNPLDYGARLVHQQPQYDMLG